MKKITKTKARALYKDVRTGLAMTETALVEIVQTKAWEVLGYSSFTEAWDAELKDVRLAASGTLRSAVVYAFIDAGLSDSQIVEATAGRVGDRTVSETRKAKAKGLSSKAAETVVRQHFRKAPSPSGNLTVTFDVNELQHFKEVAGKLGLDLEEEVRLFVKERIADLERFAA